MNVDILKNYKLPIFLIVILLAVSFISVLPVLNMILLGAMLAYGIRPIACKIQSKVNYQSLSIILAIVIVIIPLILVLAYVLLETMGMASSFLSFGGLSFKTDSSQVGAVIIHNLPPDIQNLAEPHIGRINGIISNLFNLLLNYIVDFLKDLPTLFIQLFILICSIYYFTKDGEKIWDYLFSFIPDGQESFFDNVFHEVGEVLKSIFYGHFLTALIIGIMAGIGYWILGYPFVFLLGLVTAVFQLLPILGPWITYWALILFDVFITGNIPRAVITLLFGFALSLSDMYIRPTITSRYVDVHPLILLIGFLAGPLTLGLIGFILGPLILGISYAVIKSVKEELDKEEIKEKTDIGDSKDSNDDLDLEVSSDNSDLDGTDVKESNDIEDM